jgi:Fur family ferric uptake transcriptional regulator
MAELLNILKDHKLRNTAIRREILELFLETKHALTHSFIEKRLDNNFDRVTLYRTLKTFEEKGLIHRIASDTEVIEYALCKDDCHEHDHKHLDNHAHFKCESCQRTFCLDEIAVPDIKVPQGFAAKDFQLLVMGICEQCNQA